MDKHLPGRRKGIAILPDHVGDHGASIGEEPLGVLCATGSRSGSCVQLTDRPLL